MVLLQAFLTLVLSASQAAGPRQAAVAPATSLCQLKNLEKPAAFVVYEGVGEVGQSTDQMIDDSGIAAFKFKVAVHSDQPVALFLSALQPSIWNIGWTEKTKIIAVFVTGQHRQIVTGLPAQTPVLISTQENQGACGGLVGNATDGGTGRQKGSSVQVNELAKKLFGRTVDDTFALNEVSSVIGGPIPRQAKILTSEEVDPVESAGKGFIDILQDVPEGVRHGFLRMATDRDIAALQAELEMEAGQGPKDILGFTGPDGVYVVLKKFKFPKGGFHGLANSFLVPRGVPSPEGDPVHGVICDVHESPICRKYGGPRPKMILLPKARAIHEGLVMTAIPKGCIRIAACVDGADRFRITNGVLTHTHVEGAQLGTHPDCADNLKFKNGGFLVGREIYLLNKPRAVKIKSLVRFKKLLGRDFVSLVSPGEILMDDRGEAGPATYQVELCDD